MIEAPADSVLRHIFAKHRKRFPSDERVAIRLESSLLLTSHDTLGIRIERIKGIGLDCKYRYARAEVSMEPLYHGDRGWMVTALSEAIDDLVRTILRPLLPTFRIRRDSRRLAHRSDPPTKRFASRLSRQA